MRLVYKFLLTLVLSLILISSVQAAVIAGVKAFHGGNFTSSIGGTFLLYGLEPYTIYNNETDNLELYYKRIVISSTIDDTVTIRNGTCESTNKYTYCFKGSTIETNNVKSYIGDYVQALMSITIESLPSPISTLIITRNATLKVYCGESIIVPILITNSGTIDTNVTYSETLPFNTLVISPGKGTVVENTITIKDTVPENSSKNYTYVMTNFDCKSKNWSGKYSFTTYNDTLSRNITNLGIVVQEAYNATSNLSINKTNNPDAEITYTWIINNTHPSLPLGLDMSFNIPGAVITDTSKDIVHIGDKYTYVAMLPVRSTLKLYLTFHGSDYRDYTVYTNGKISVDNHVIEYNSSKTFQVMPAIVDTYLEMNTTKNNSLYVSLWAKNYDVNDKYYYIYGVLKGIGDEEPVYANSIDPDSTLLVTKKFYNTTGMGIEEINMVFDGIYRDINSIEHPIHAEQLVNINNPKIIIVNTTTKSPSITKTNSTTNNQTTAITTSQNNTTGNITNSGEKIVEKDFITKVLEGLSNFLSSIFG